jgi:PKD repeat protein
LNLQLICRILNARRGSLMRTIRWILLFSLTAFLFTGCANIARTYYGLNPAADRGTLHKPKPPMVAAPWAVNRSFEEDQAGWLYTWGGTVIDEVGGIEVDADGNVYVGALFQGTLDFNPGPGIDEYKSEDGRNVCLTKFGPNGEYFWTRTMGFMSPGVADLGMDGAGNVYAAGTVHQGAMNSRYSVRKYSPDGEFLWDIATIPIGRTQDPPMMVVDRAGNVYMATSLDGLVDFDPGPEVHEYGRRGEIDQGFLASYGPDGAYRWAHAWVMNSRSPMTALGVDRNGNVILAGKFDEEVDFDPGPEEVKFEPAAADKSFIAGFNTDGEFQWVKQIDGSTNYTGTDIVFDTAGNFWVTGMFYEHQSAEGINSSLTHLFMREFSPDGEVLTTRDLWSNGVCYALKTVLDSGGGMLVGGAFKENQNLHSKSQNFELVSDFQWNYFLFKLDSEGEVDWLKTWGHSMHEQYNPVPPIDIALDPQGNVFVGGSFKGTVDFDDSEREVVRIASESHASSIVFNIGPNGGMTQGRNTEPPRALSDAFIMKLSPHGNFFEEGAGIPSTLNASYPFSDPKGPRYTHRLLGIWDIIVDIPRRTANAVKDDESFTRFGIPESDIPPDCDDCMQARIIGVGPQNSTVTVEIQLRNPFENLRALCGRAVIIADDTLDLESREGYTDLWYEGDKEVAYPIFGFPEATLADPIPFFDYGETYTRQLTFGVPSGTTSFTFRLVADMSSPGPPMEPALISGSQVVRDWLPDGTEKFTVSTRVLDAQEDVPAVIITQMPFSNYTGQATTSLTQHQWYLSNNERKPPGDYQVIVRAISPDAPDLALYGTIDLSISGSNPPVPSACFEYFLNTQHWTPGHPVAFNARCSSTPYIEKYHWDWDDGSTEDSNDSWVEHAYSAPGTYNVKLVVEIGDIQSQPFVLPVVCREATVAQELTPSDWNFFPKELDVRGRYAFIAAGKAGLVVMDVSDPKSPKMAARYALPGEAMSIDVEGNYAYVACYASGLMIVDVSNPLEPSKVGQYVPDGATVDVVRLRGNTAYIGLGNSRQDWETEQHMPASQGAVIGLNVSNSASPNKVFTQNADQAGVQAMDIDGDRLYYVERDSLKVLNLAGGSPRPEQAGNLEGRLQAIPERLVARDNSVYICDMGSVLIADRQSSGGFTFRNFDEPWGTCVEISGKYAFVAGAVSGITVYDMTNPGSPVNLARVSASGVIDMEVVDNYYLLAAESGGFEVFDISDVTNIEKLNTGPAPGAPVQPYPSEGPLVAEQVEPSGGVYSFNGSCRPIINGNYLYVASSGTGWRVLDISNPESPTIVTQVEIPAAQDAVISGRYAYTVEQGGIAVVDLDNPDNPSLLGSCDLEDSVDSLAYENGTVCATGYLTDEHMLFIVDAVNPRSPWKMLGCMVDGQCWDVVMADGYAYVAADEKGVAIIDVDPPERPSVVGYIDIRDKARTINLYQNHLIVTGQGRTVAVLEIKSPGNIQFVKDIVASYSVASFYIENGVGYAGTWDTRILRFDVDPPADLTELEPIGTGFKVDDIVVRNRLGFIVSRDEGFHIVKLP